MNSACEHCWEEAGGDAVKYLNLLRKRDCTPEQQAGSNAKKCPKCGRMTLHQHTGSCMRGCKSENGRDEQ